MFFYYFLNLNFIFISFSFLFFRFLFLCSFFPLLRLYIRVFYPIVSVGGLQIRWAWPLVCFVLCAYTYYSIVSWFT